MIFALQVLVCVSLFVFSQGSGLFSGGEGALSRQLCRTTGPTTGEESL